MMTITLRIALILVSLGTFAMIMRKIRQSRMQIESAIFWIVLALVLVVYSVFPKVADACASLLGIYATTNFLFLFAIFVLILKVFFMSIHISQLESKIKELVQAMALEEKKYEEEIAAQTDPIAKAKAGKYNAETEEIPITVKKVQYADKGIQSIMAAVWKYDDQSDLQWVPLAMYDGDVWKGNINISGYDSPEGAYNIHLYLVDGNGDLYNIACTSKNIKINNE